APTRSVQGMSISNNFSPQIFVVNYSKSGNPVRFILYSIFTFFIAFSSLAQGGYVPPKVPDKSCKDLDAAVLSAKAGATERSIASINTLIEKYPTWIEARHQLSRIYFEAGKKGEAINVLEKSIAIDTLSQLQQLYTLGRLYEETGEYEKAIHTYTAVTKLASQQPSLVQRASTSLQSLLDKMELIQSNYTVTLHPFHEGVNSTSDEALGRWTLDGRSVIFTRHLDRQEDLFTSQFDDDGKLLKVGELSFNSEFNEGGHAISPDGKYIVFTSCDRIGMGSCDLFLSVMKEGEWTKPINMGPSFNSAAWDGQPVFGLDGKSIYFASTRSGGFGGSDIWMVRQLSKEKWSAPMNVGRPINTADNDESPFISFDGRTIYFMRDGKGGIGGYDLYLARLGIDGKWKDVENMGSPINSSSDEGALAVHPDGKRALITRLTDDRRNDLFEFELPEQFRSSPVQVVYLHLNDADTRNPVKGRIELIDVIGTDTIRTSQLGDEKGIITISAEKNKTYGVIATAGGYIMHSTSLPVDTGAVRHIDIEMTALVNVSSKTFVLRNIFFETGSAKLLASSNTELNRLQQTLQENKSMKIEIHGHTDNVGSDPDNQVLSESRAKSVYQYLIDRGIDAGRLSFKGFGEMQPVASNETEAGRKKNRRTEFFVVSIQ
ncbi:MAG: OmpA family protein, partial [Saprospiraceae bacterium]